MNKLSRFVTKHSKSIIVVVILITLFLGYFAAQIKIKAGFKDMLPEDNAKVEDFEEVGDLFGGTSFAAVILEDENILDASSLKKIDEMTQKFKKIDGIEDVTSLTNVKDIRGDFFGIEVVEFIEQLPKTEADILNLKEELSKNDQYMGSIVSEDFRSAVILLTFQHEVENIEDVVQEIREVAQPYEGPEKLYITGSRVMISDANEAMKNDLAKLMPFVVIIIVLILWLTFRSASGVILPLATVLISIIWTIGILSLLGKSLSIISVVLPVLLVSVGSAYAIHIITRYYEELHTGCAVEEAVTNTINKVGVGVLIAGITTMAGFASLFLSELKVIKDFALGTAFGVGVALLISIIFVPAVYLHLPKPKNMKAAEGRPLSNRFFQRTFKLVLNHRPLIVSVVVLVIIASFIAIPKIQPETSYLNYFRNDSETRIAAKFANQNFGGSTSLDVVIFGDIKDPVLLTKMRDFQDEAEKIDGINKPLSMVDLFREENKALNGDDESMAVIPTNKKQIAQYLLLLTMSDKDIAKSLLTFDESKTRIQLRMEMVSSDEMSNVIAQVQDLILKHFGDDYKVILTGAPVMDSEISDIIIASQIKSVIASVLLIFLITSLLLKSFKRGLFCSLIIGLTVIINFGIMGWFKIPLDVATAMIASVAIGIGADYSIHIYTRYLEEKEQEVDTVEALNVAIYTVGRANLYNALAVIAGFCVILASSFPPLVNFGGLTAITMVVSFAGAIFILPTLILAASKIAKKVSVRLANKF